MPTMPKCPCPMANTNLLTDQKVASLSLAKYILPVPKPNIDSTRTLAFCYKNHQMNKKHIGGIHLTLMDGPSFKCDRYKTFWFFIRI